MTIRSSGHGSDRTTSLTTNSGKPSTRVPDVPRRILMQQLSLLRERLHEHGIRDASDYAEVLIAEVLRGRRMASGVTKGHDIISPKFGRVEVKCRHQMGDVEERVEVSSAKEAGFDHLAIVVFRSDFAVKGAIIVPYAAVWKLVQSHQ